MNYKLIYDNLIFRAQNRVLEGYSEKHHIIARCFGGTNAKSNIVKLTGKEHYLAHRLLTKIYPSHKGLAFAFWMMCNSTKRTAYKPSPKAYEEAKQQIAKRVREHLGTPEAIKKMAESKKGYANWTGRKHKPESIEKQKLSALTRKTTVNNETRRREGISKSHSKVVLQYDLNMNLVNEWPSVITAAKGINTHVGSIVHAIQGKRVKQHKGFVWKYKIEKEHEG